LGWPNTDLPTVIKDKPVGATIFKDGVIIFILVEFDTAVEARAILRMAIVSLARTLQYSFRVLSKKNTRSISSPICTVYTLHLLKKITVQIIDPEIFLICVKSVLG
jgi:hypothetical protein